MRAVPLLLALALALVGCSGPYENLPATERTDAAAFLSQVEAAAPADRLGLLKGHPQEHDALRADPIMRARLDRALGLRQ